MVAMKVAYLDMLHQQMDWTGNGKQLSNCAFMQLCV